jgi:polyisoprenoid-binding protein YceI
MAEQTIDTTTATAVQPEPGTYEIDRSHSMVEFVGRHLMVTKVRGHFGSYSGAITIAEPPGESSVNVTIDAASIDTGDEKRDGHLRSPDFLDVENHPTLEFRSTGIDVGDDERFRITGDLTVHGETHPVTLDATFDGSFSDPWGGSRVGFTASTEIDREKWGLTWNVPLETGGVLVGKKIRLDLTVSAVKQV